MGSYGGGLAAAARVHRPAGSSLTSLRHPIRPRSREGGGRTTSQVPRQIRVVVRLAQRHQGGARRAGDSRGAECAAALIPPRYPSTLARHHLRIQRSAAVNDGPRLKAGFWVKRVHGPGTNGVAQGFQVGGGGAGHVHIEVVVHPSVVHMVFGVG